jgi:hypothetical protein
LDSETRIQHRREVEPAKGAFNSARLALLATHLQNLQQHHVADEQRLLSDEASQPLDLGGGDPGRSRPRPSCRPRSF